MAFLFVSLALCVLDMLIHPTLTNVEDVSVKLGCDIYGNIPKEDGYISRRHMFADLSCRIPPMQELAKNYDIVLVDTAPVGQVSDTLFIKRIADAVLSSVLYGLFRSLQRGTYRG